MWPSGAARATKDPAIVPLAPGLLSTVTGWPTWAESFSAKIRAIVSVPLPRANRITMLIGLVGHAARASAAVDTVGPSAAAAAEETRNWRRSIIVSFPSLYFLSYFFLRLTNAPMRSMCSPSVTDCAKASMPACTASSSDNRSQRRISRFCARTASGVASTIECTQRSTAASIFAASTTSSTMPQASALRGVDILAGEQHPRGAAPADQARQQRRLDHRGDADLHLGHAEMRRVGGDAQVAGGRHFKASAQRVAFQAADHRHGTVADRLAELVDQGDEGAPVLGLRIPAMWLMSAPPMKALTARARKTTTRRSSSAPRARGRFR